MIFKDDRVRDEYAAAPTFLLVVCATFEDMSRALGVEPVVTRVREAVAGSSGVHEAGRAVDFRDEHGGAFLYSERDRDALVTRLNDRYTRNDGKMTCVWHSFHEAPHHFHVQIAADMAAYRKEAPHA